MIKIIVGTLLVSLFLIWFGGLLYPVFGWFPSFYHDILGWHDGKGSSVGFDGCSATGTCSKCGKSVLQDSQGNWF